MRATSVMTREAMTAPAAQMGRQAAAALAAQTASQLLKGLA